MRANVKGAEQKEKLLIIENLYNNKTTAKCWLSRLIVYGKVIVT